MTGFCPNRPLRVLLSIHHRLDPDSGAAGVVMRIASEYHQLGHDVRVASPDDYPGWLPQPIRNGIFMQGLGAAARRWQPDVVDASSGDAWSAFAELRHAKVVPLLVTHSHGLEHLASRAEVAEQTRAGRAIPLRKRAWRHGLRLHLVARSFRLADLKLVLNGAEATFLEKQLGIDPHGIRRVRLGTEHAGSRIERDRRDPHAMVQIGAYTTRKGVSVAASALRSVMTGDPRATMTFLGVGVPPERVLADYPKALHSRIKVIPQYANGELRTLLAVPSICMMPSMFEGYGIAKLEAMALGLAVVVSDDPGARTDISHGINGLVVPRGNAGALASALARLLRHPDWSCALGDAGQRTAAGFTWRSVARERLEYYACAAGGRTSLHE